MLFLGQGQEAPPCPARRGPPGPAAEAPTHLCDLYGLRQGDLRHGRGGGGGDGGPGVAVLLAGGVLLHRGGQQLRLRLRLLQQQLLLGRRQRELGGTGHVSGRGAGGAEPRREPCAGPLLLILDSPTARGQVRKPRTSTRGRGVRARRTREETHTRQKRKGPGRRPGGRGRRARGGSPD